jgi:D-alanyl-D-alanine carboxypeptidase
MRAALQNRTFCEIVSTKYVSVAGRSLKNHNKLLWEYAGMLGGKTGYTKSAGRTLVTCAERGDMRLICVTLSDPDDWADQSRLFDWAFDSFERVDLSALDDLDVTIPVISGVKSSVTLRPDRDYSFIFKKSAVRNFELETRRFVYAVVVKGARAGYLVVRQDGAEVARIPLVYGDTVLQDTENVLTASEKIARAWFRANQYSTFYLFNRLT